MDRPGLRPSFSHHSNCFSRNVGHSASPPGVAGSYYSIFIIDQKNGGAIGSAKAQQDSSLPGNKGHHTLDINQVH